MRRLNDKETQRNYPTLSRGVRRCSYVEKTLDSGADFRGCQ